jgi:two-component system cell cycle sensor histidine kinase/response regulator CckA
VDRFIPEPLRAAHRQHIATYGRSGDAARFISEHRNLHGLRRNGEKFPIEASISQLELEGRKIYLAIIRDISQRKRADRLLQQTEEKYRKLFEESKDAVFISSMEGKFLDINAAGVKLFGYDSKEELMQVNIPKELYANPPHRDEILRIYQARGYAENIEITIKRKDGTFRTVLETSTAMRDENGNIVALQGILRDITERKTLETQLLQAQKMEAIGQLAGGIAHDFNNILTAILGYSDLMRIDLSENDPRIRLIEEISKAGYRAASLIRQLLAFSRRQLMQPRNLELNSLVTEMDQMLHRLIGENINLAVNLDPQLGQVRADPGQIQQVILNLIVNARDAMPQGGSLTLHTSNTELEDGPEAQQLSAPPGRYIVLAVSDTGHGIDPEVQTRIFEPFFTTKDKGKGTGLGLSTVYGIVKQSGGFIAVQSEQGKGATFKIYLPRIEAPEVCPKPITASLVATLGGTETILLVEDEAAVRSLAREILSSYGYRVLEAANGGEALTLCRSYEREIHGILTDIVMPGMSGPELVRQLKPLYPRMKVLFVSGYSYAEMAQNQTLDPGSAFVPKPFTSVELAQAMRRLLDEGKSPTQSLSPSQYSP